MNYIELLENIKNQIDYTTFNILHNDFMDTFRTEYKKARYTKTTAKNAIEKYIENAKYKDHENAGVYATPATLLLVAGNNANIQGKNTEIKNDLLKVAMEMIKDRKPTECYFIESIALHKILKRQNNENYFLRVENRYYNPELVATMIECVVTDKEKYIRAEICKNGALMIQQDNAAAVILPYIWKEIPKNKNVNFKDFLEYTKGIENDLLNNILKTA